MSSHCTIANSTALLAAQRERERDAYCYLAELFDDGSGGRSVFRWHGQISRLTSSNYASLRGAVYVRHR